MTIRTVKDEHVWTEKYRPTVIEDCILPPHIKKQFAAIVESGKIPNMVLSGGPGTGKTTAARAMCQELGVDWIIINCSEETGIDTLRTTIKDFASTVSFSDNGKCIILDEFDYASHNLQAGLRNALEAFSKTCSFIMTCNYPNKIMGAIFSRSPHISFKFSKEEIPQLQAQLFKRVKAILENEQVPHDARSVISLVTKFFPDNRRILNELQQYSKTGAIDEGILMQLEETNLENLIKFIKAKNFKEIRQWCAQNSGNDLSTVYGNIYKVLKEECVPDSIPEAIMILNDYQRFDSTVPDKELHLAAMAVQLMIQVNWK